MSWTRRRLLAGAAAAPLLGFGTAARARVDRPNILLIFPDQLRASALSAYGETNIETKVFDRLLNDSVHFTSAYCPNPVCAPSRAGLLTGLMPHAAGVERNGNGLSSKIPTVASLLRKDGYSTGYIGKWHLSATKEHPGFVPRSDRGGFQWFAGYNVSHRYRKAVYYINGRRPVRPDPPDRFEPEYQVDLALQFMEKARNPFFCMVSFGPPHPPGTAPIDDWSLDLPKGALGAVDPGQIVIPPNVPTWMIDRNRGEHGDAPEEPGARHHLHGYYASILALELSIRRLLRGLDQLGLEQDTLVVLASDHGEMGGAHGQYQKGEPFEEAVRVPLAFRWPGSLKPQAVEALTSTVDLTPTLLGIAGVSAPPGLHGLDLRPWLRGRAGDERTSVMVQGRLGREETWRMIRTRRYSWAEWPHTGRKALYDLDEDPHQLHDLADSRAHAELRDGLSAELRTWRSRVGDVHRRPTRRSRPGGDDA